MNSHKRILLPHIPKCAGSSIRSQIRHASEYIEHYDLHPTWQSPGDTCDGEAAQAKLLERISKDGQWVLFGHYRVSDMYSLDYEKQILVIRNPVERAISHFNFIKRKLIPTEAALRRHPEVAPIKSGDMSVLEFTKLDHIRNFYSGYYLKDLNINRKLTVLDTSNMTRVCSYLEHALEIKISPLVRENQTTYAPEEHSQFTPEIKRLLRNDLVLYSFLAGALQD